MNDIEKAFSFLHDNIPQWLGNAAEIERKIVAMQSELSKIPVSRSLPFKKRTGSIESIRDLDAIRERPETQSAEAEAEAIQPEPITRKRKEPSLLSEQQSVPTKLRSRTMIVVNYDGHIQTAFEQLVRAIGTGRNMLRKGKMAAKLEAMAALAGSSDDDDDDDDSNAIMSKIGYRHRAGLSSMRTRGMMRMSDPAGTPTERFDTADKALEESQALCERAAHQSLREGDCRKELNAVRKHFDQVAEIAKGQVARYVSQRLVAKEKEQQMAATLEANLERRSANPLPPVEKERVPTVALPATRIYTNSKVVDIEIDDEEEDSEDINFVMPPIRLTSRV